MHVRRSNWKFGSTGATGDVARWWHQHEPVVDAWLGELEQARDPWWVSAEHAAFCLVSFQELGRNEEVTSPSWDDFDVEYFLFNDLREGGTVGFYGSVEIFFDQLVDGFGRFVNAGLVDAHKGARWLSELKVRRARFLSYYPDWEDPPACIARRTELPD